MRSFNRLYTKAIGVLDDSTQPEGLSLTAARVIYELSQRDGLTAKQLIDQLGLDAGYLSRILAGFEKKRWITRQASPRDRRATLLSLTSRGRAVAAKLEQHMQQRIGELVKPLTPGQQEELTAAMQRIRGLLSGEQTRSPLVIRPLRLGDAGWIIHRHGALIAAEHGWDEKFEALCAQILADFIRNYDANGERSWIAERDGQILGSLFLIRQDAQTARLRLLYVEAAARGMGLATRLMERAVRFARDKGYRKLELFTTSENEAARRIYQRMGFTRVSAAPSDLFGEGLMGEMWELPL